MCKNGFILSEKLGYFKNNGVDVMAFDDFYPSGHHNNYAWQPCCYLRRYTL